METVFKEASLVCGLELCVAMLIIKKKAIAPTPTCFTSRRQKRFKASSAIEGALSEGALSEGALSIESNTGRLDTAIVRFLDI